MEMFAIICDGIFDQAVETKALANKEAKDLRAMGFVVRVIYCANADELEAIENKFI